MNESSPVDLRCSTLFFRKDSLLLCEKTEPGGIWVLPGGTPHQGEGSAAAARREVAEETGLQVAAERVIFVMETTSWEGDRHLVEIVFLGSERDPSAQPVQREAGLRPSFVDVDRIQHLQLLPPIAGYIRGFARSWRRGHLTTHTGSYLGNVWRPLDGIDSPSEGSSI